MWKLLFPIFFASFTFQIPLKWMDFLHSLQACCAARAVLCSCVEGQWCLYQSSTDWAAGVSYQCNPMFRGCVTVWDSLPCPGTWGGTGHLLCPALCEVTVGFLSWIHVLMAGSLHRTQNVAFSRTKSLSTVWMDGWLFSSLFSSLLRPGAGVWQVTGAVLQSAKCSSSQGSLLTEWPLSSAS